MKNTKEALDIISTLYEVEKDIIKLVDTIRQLRPNAGIYNLEEVPRIHRAIDYIKKTISDD